MDLYIFIIVINCLAAIITIVLTFFKSKLTIVPILNFLFSLITAITTEYNAWTITLIIISLILLGVFSAP